jgi:AbrB family looped-hinge helix DNA binding protein
MPEIFGSVKVGERGQVVIPLEARERMGLRPGDRLLAMGSPAGLPGILLIKTESFSSLMAEITAKLAGLESLLRAAGVHGSDPGPGTGGDGRTKRSRP